MRSSERFVEERKNNIETVSLTVPSHARFLYVVRSALYPIVADAGFSRKETRKIILAVDEACSNIIKHAYGGRPGEPITVTVSLSPNEFQIELKDLGEKADPSTIVPRKLADVRPGGLGTHFMKEVFDSVHYDTSGERGTILTLLKKRVSPSEEHIQK